MKDINKRFKVAKAFLGWSSAKVARVFGLTPQSFGSSTARQRYIKAFITIVEETIKKTSNEQ